MSSAQVQRTPDPKARLAWVDQLRTLAIVLVVNMHACVTYSHVGSWYVKDGPDLFLLDRLVFIFWQGHLQSFFMGILFLVAGYFAHGSVQRRGASGFVRERLFRLGLPTLLYMVALNPLIVLVLNPSGEAFGPLPAVYGRYLAQGRFLGGSGPMWFAAALLVFSSFLAAWRLIRPAQAAAAGAPPRPASVLAWGLALVASTFLTRIVEPVGSSVLNMQLCYFPQYVLAFCAGVAAARGGWLQPLARSALARRSGWAALVLGPVALSAVLFGSGALKGSGAGALLGGWHLASLAFCGWEQMAGLGLGLGALAFCSGKLDITTPLSSWLSRRSFGVYLLHPPVLVALTIAMRPLDIDAFFKVSLLTGAGLTVSFLLSDLAGRVPGLSAIL